MSEVQSAVPKVMKQMTIGEFACWLIINQDALAKYMKMAGGDDAAGETETEGDEQGAENDEQAEE